MLTRRELLKNSLTLLGSLSLGACLKQDIFKEKFRELSEEEKRRFLKRLEERYEKRYGIKFSVRDTPPQKGVVFGYALDLSRCIGCRRCVYACVMENNQSRDIPIQWIRVLRIKKGHFAPSEFESAEHYYNPEKVPEDGYIYIPVQCQQCENPPCVKVCPTKATWKEPDGIVVIDYEWCIGCRCCMAACPYWARRFNWKEPYIPEKEINPDTHYYGNRPRMRGVVEKCTFCIQRTRNGRYPACVEACPVGARKFGNLLDPESEVRYILDNFSVFRLKAELNTEPKFFYFFSLGR